MQFGDCLFEIQTELGLLYFIWQAPTLAGCSFPGTGALRLRLSLSAPRLPRLPSTPAPGPPERLFLPDGSRVAYVDLCFGSLSSHRP